MHIKRFEADTLRDALDQIREELGPDALILESRKAEDGSARVVVRAALPRTEIEGAERSAAAISALEGRGSTRVGGLTLREGLSGRGAIAPALGAQFGAPRDGGPVAGRPRPSLASPNPAPAREEALESRMRLEYLSRLIRSDHFSAIPLPLRDLYLNLVDADLDSNLVFQILQRMGSAPLPGQFQTASPDALLGYLRGLIPIGGMLQPDTRRRVIALVGPTGVGKTTTAAKIAGTAAFKLGLRVAIVSTDTYRIFGAEHLANYAALMGLPFETAGSAAEMRGVLLGPLSRANLVLIDTTGRSPRDPEGIAEVHDLLAAWPELDVTLVLAANARVRDLSRALESFSLLPIRHLVFTKLDETTARGGIVSVALKARRPVAYLGTGQEVPDDLIPASAEAMTQDLLTEEEAA